IPGAASRFVHAGNDDIVVLVESLLNGSFQQSFQFAAVDLVSGKREVGSRFVKFLGTFRRFRHFRGSSFRSGRCCRRLLGFGRGLSFGRSCFRGLGFFGLGLGGFGFGRLALFRFRRLFGRFRRRLGRFLGFGFFLNSARFLLFSLLG